MVFEMPTHPNAVAHKAAWRVRTHAWALAELGGKCVVCQVTEGLEFDHIVPGSRSFAISEGIAQCFSRERLLTELVKCQLLCHLHHRQKTVACGEAGGGQNKILDPKHGTQVMYALPYRCRCGACRDWKRNYRNKIVDAQGQPRSVPH